MLRKRAALTAVVLGTAMLACAAPTATTTLSVDEVGTRVAATMTALAIGGPVGPAASAEPHEPVTEVPSPTPEPVLTVVYTDAGNVWLIREGTPPTQLTTSGGASDVRISDDGTLIAFIRRETPDGRGELRAVGADGSGETILLAAADLDTFYPPAEYIVGTDISSWEFIPGTHTLVFNTYGIPEFVGWFTHNDLWTMDANTGTLSSLLPSGSGGEFTVSPDGSQIAVARPTSISLMNSDGTDLRADLVTFPPVVTYSEFRYSPHLVWAPDSSAVGVVIPSEDPLGPTPTGGVWRIPADEGPAILLATISGDCYFPSFGGNTLISPDLSRVAFIRPTATPNVETLFVANADGSGEIAYATGAILWEGWSPDASHFVFTLDEPMGLQLGTLGSAPVPLGTGTDVRWVNSAEVLYLSGSMGSWTLMHGTLGIGSSALASPTGDTVSFDFTE